MRPATAGVLIEVPDRVAEAAVFPMKAPSTLTPPAKSETTTPVFENLATVSLESIAPTVTEYGERPGE
jgi:hypothetical protein